MELTHSLAHFPEWKTGQIGLKSRDKSEPFGLSSPGSREGHLYP